MDNMARISPVAYRVLKARADANKTSIAQELDKLLHIEQYQIEEHCRNCTYKRMALDQD